MHEIAEARVRYGYRRVHVLLRREGSGVNATRVYRLQRELGLQLRQKPAEAPGGGEAERGPPRGVVFE